MSAVLVQRGYRSPWRAPCRDTIESVRREQPDVCLIDRHFAGENRITAIGPMLAASSRTPRCWCSARTRTPRASGRRCTPGASGYLHKTRGVAALTRAIDRVQRGEVVVDVPKPRPARDRARPRRRAPAGRLPHRPGAGMPRRCWSRGWTRPVSRPSWACPRPPSRTHVQSVLTKLGVHSRLEAASYAVRYGLLDDRAERSRA